MFGVIKDNWRKSEAAVVIQNLLEHQRNNLMFAGDPAKTANALVGETWDRYPVVMSGKKGPRPHKLSIAAVSLYQGVSAEAPGSENQSSFLFAIGQILSEIASNVGLYPLTYVDEQLLDPVAESFQSFTDKMNNDPMCRELDQLFGIK